MEDLRILPLFMFFAGALLMYAGLSGQNPSDIMRNALTGAAPSGDGTVPYSPSTNPVYAGINTYSRPTPYGDLGYF